MKNILYELRCDKRKTQLQIANYLGIGQSYYNRLEKADVKTISSETLLKLAKFYAVSVDYLLGIPATEFNPNEVTLIARGGTKKTFTISDEKLNAIESMLKAMEDTKKNS